MVNAAEELFLFHREFRVSRAHARPLHARRGTTLAVVQIVLVTSRNGIPFLRGRRQTATAATVLAFATRTATFSQLFRRSRVQHELGQNFGTALGCLEASHFPRHLYAADTGAVMVVVMFLFRIIPRRLRMGFLRVIHRFVIGQRWGTALLDATVGLRRSGGQ